MLTVSQEVRLLAFNQGLRMMDMVSLSAVKSIPVVLRLFDILASHVLFRL